MKWLNLAALLVAIACAVLSAVDSNWPAFTGWLTVAIYSAEKNLEGLAR